MAGRRARRRGEEQNLDSLLDTMANVTGILIVMLAVTQISMGDAMGRLRDLLAARPELTPAALERASEEATSLRAALAAHPESAVAIEAERDALRDELEALRAGSGALRADLARARDADPDVLRARLREQAAREQELRGTHTGARAERTALESQLAALSARPLARDVPLPDPRPAPAGAREVPVLVRYGRVLVADDRELLSQLFHGVERALGEPLDTLSLSLLPFHQRIRLSAYFDRTPVGSQGLRWRMAGEGSELVATLEWRRKTLGESASELALPSSDFRRELRRTSSQRAFLRYFVWADSFESYLAARRASDAEGFAAGFLPFEEHVTIHQPLTRNPSRRIFVD